jgi:Protein of unknown function (DUF1488)
MPLSRGREQILTTANGVEFLMQDRGLEVPCEATPELLAGRFDSEGTPLSQQQAFLFHRIAIEQAASAKYDAGGSGLNIDRGIVVTAKDMASPLSQKF